MLLRRIKGIRIEGKKAMSCSALLQDYLDPPVVAIPLLQGSAPLKPAVEIGSSVKIGDIIAYREGLGAMPIHASIAGKVTAIKKVWHACGRMVEALEIENDHSGALSDSIKPEIDPEGLDKDALIKKMIDAGLAGLGGAGFPTYVKYQSGCPIDTIIINAIECEPYLTCDYLLSVRHPEKLVKGLHYFMKAAGAEKGVIAYKGYNQAVEEAIKPYLEKYPGITAFPFKDVYPAGWQKYLTEAITGKTYSKLPSEAGAIVNNSGTAIAFADMVENNIPLIARSITITGEGITNPQNFYVPLGTKVADLVKLCGGYREGLDPKYAWYIAGGPMTGRAILIDDLVVSETLGAVVVIPMPKEKLHPECLGCGKCADACPAFLTPTEIKRAADMKDKAALIQLQADKCIACGLCSYVCPSHIEITDAVVKARDSLKKGA
ncbi:MAG: RnfABCDGE type electron transport complex subunit C [Candidatus Izemoplasmatales bacterium]|jgi:electron transport complex protein RnfC